MMKQKGYSAQFKWVMILIKSYYLQTNWLFLQLLEGHSDYVNSVCFEPEQGDQLASVSDDHTCRVWQIDGTEQVRLPLGAPGMSVCWHIEEPSKVRE